MDKLEFSIRVCKQNYKKVIKQMPYSIQSYCNQYTYLRNMVFQRDRRVVLTLYIKDGKLKTCVDDCDYDILSRCKDIKQFLHDIQPYLEADKLGLL